MRRMLTYGLDHVMGKAFGGGAEAADSIANQDVCSAVSSGLSTPEGLDLVDALGCSEACG